MNTVDALIHAVASGAKPGKALDRFLANEKIQQEERIQESSHEDQFNMLMNMYRGGKSKDEINKQLATRLLGLVGKQPPKAEKAGLFSRMFDSAAQAKKDEQFQKDAAKYHLMRNLLGHGIGKATDFVGDLGTAAARHAASVAASKMYKAVGPTDMSHVMWPGQYSVGPAPAPQMPELPSSLNPQHLAAGKTHGASAPQQFLPPSPLQQQNKFEPSEFLGLS